ncbi:hypothetical protein OAY12_04715 [Candidatus Pelagibacter sp.]|nr:hypothetical protein [Candidatus Pelagibacter sp.]
MNKKKNIYFIVAEENVEKIYKFNEILLKQLSKKFENIYFLNLFNLKLFTKKKVFNDSQVDDKIFIINFDNTKKFKEFILDKKILAIVFLGKDPSFFLIHNLINKKNIKLIMIMNLSQIGNKMTIDFNFKYLFSAYKHYYSKGFYYLFRFLTIINVFPKIHLLFESNLEMKSYIENSRSRKLEKIFPFNISYFKKVEIINSRYFDSINLIRNESRDENKNIVYIDTHFDHLDKIHREGKLDKNKQNFFYENLKAFLLNISKLYKIPVKICKHPKNKSDHSFYKTFEISKNSTDKEIYESKIVIFTLSSAILNAVLLKKPIINLRSSYLGDYMSNIGRQYVQQLGLVSFDLDYSNTLNKSDLDDKLKGSIKNYSPYINKKLLADGDISPNQKIANILDKEFNKLDFNL